VGVIVEQRSLMSPVDQVLNETTGSDDSGEVLLQDVLDAIALATDDNRITSLVLMPGASRSPFNWNAIAGGRAPAASGWHGSPALGLL
jgi:hypothetical protein